MDVAESKRREALIDFYRGRSNPAAERSIATNSRDEHVDAARGIACILLVLWHTVGATPTTGLALDGGFWRFMVNAFIYVRMPMFAFLSGYVYGKRPFAGEIGQFILGKARRLLLPFFVVGTVFVLTQSMVRGTHGNEDWFAWFINPSDSYWFLESLFIVFVLMTALERSGLLANRVTFALVWTTAIVTQLTIPIPWMFSLSGAAYLFPYFLGGLACFRFCIVGNRILYSALAVFTVAMCYAVAGELGYFPQTGRISIVALLAGTSAAFLVLRSGWRNEFLMFIGRCSYTIFLYHVFFTAGARILLYSFNVREINTVVVMVTSCGIFGPILLENIFDRFAVTRIALLGKSSAPSKATMFS